MDPNSEALMITASSRLGATQAHAYSWRAPSPPHISIPPTTEDNEIVLPAYNGVGLDQEEQEVLKIITQGSHVNVKEKEWKYEWRRDAQPILSFLYLGPSAAARDIEALKREGITMLLVIRNTRTAQAKMLSGEKVANQLGIQAASLDVAGNQELIAAFPRAVKIINNHLVSMYRQYNDRRSQAEQDTTGTTWGKVLVFCESGNERSACVVAAYIMSMYDIDLVETVQYLQNQRFCVAFDDGLKNILLNFQQILQASRNVSAIPSSSSLNPETKGGGKRGRNEMAIDEDTDMDMDRDHEDDLERFGNRSTFAPFK